MQSPPNKSEVDSKQLIAALTNPLTYGLSQDQTIEVLETHISWIFLAGEFAYKVKKPIEMDFLDYSTLEKRKKCCDEELRLDRRYAPDLYESVVPISLKRVSVEEVPVGDLGSSRVGPIIEYAVKMKRFESDALLGSRIQAGRVQRKEMVQLADSIADFHLNAKHIVEPANYEQILEPALTNFDVLGPKVDALQQERLDALKKWTIDEAQRIREQFKDRNRNGWIRECHGDLHLGNIVFWKGKWVPFDGIEFCEAFRNIDILCDTAFLVMDLAKKQRVDLARIVLNSYLEVVGERAGLSLLRWYQVYLALVRAKVAAIRAEQLQSEQPTAEACWKEVDAYLQLAGELSEPGVPRLWITHGVSGSGKTTVSEEAIVHWGAIRVRSDVERKRLRGMSPSQRSESGTGSDLYSNSMNDATYTRLFEVASEILESGFSVVIDAAFLSADKRQDALELAKRLKVPFGILDCQADERTLRERLEAREQRGTDASDAGIDVMLAQERSRDPLSEEEQSFVVAVPTA